MSESSPTPAPTPPSTPPRSVAGYVLLLILWFLALLSWLLWMSMILYVVSRVFGADAR